MYNAATYLAALRRHLEGVYSPEPSVAYPDSELLLALNEAQRIVQDQLGWLRYSVLLPVTVGSSSFALPDYVMGQRILGITVVDGSTRYNLARLPYSEMILGDTTQVGYPVYWSVDESSYGNLLISPCPGSAVSLLLSIQPIPTPMSRVFYQPGVVYASGSAGSASLSLFAADQTTPYAGSGESAADSYWAGLEVGFCNTNAITGVVEMPVTWYRVESADMTTGILTLSSALPCDISLSSIIAGQVSDYDKAFPGRLGNILPDLAASRLLQLPDPKKSAMIQQSVQASIASLTPDLPPTTSVSCPRYHSALSRSRINL